FLKRRHREKPKLITICDVSDSVRNASRFMLQLVWSLQECFSRVRSYVFVSEIAEVTQAFSAFPVERGIEWALKAAPVDYHCRSDFGFAFSRFANTELESLDRKTTILVLGEARNNYNDQQRSAVRHFVIAVLLVLAGALPVMLVSPPVVPAEDDCKLIDDFGRAKVGEFPGDWKPRKDAGKSVYVVQEESGKRFLHATSKGLG